MHVKDRFVALEAHVIEQRHVTLKTLANKGLMVAPHRDDKIRLLDQFLGELALNMSCDISSFEAEPRLNPFVNGLGVGINTG